jgi:hypothetical protein
VFGAMSPRGIRKCRKSWVACAQLFCYNTLDASIPCAVIGLYSSPR